MTGLETLEKCRAVLEEVRKGTGILPTDELSMLVAQYGKLLTLSRTAIRGLSRAQALVLWHRFCLGLSLTQTAEELHYSRRNVTRIQQEALFSLRKIDDE